MGDIGADTQELVALAKTDPERLVARIANMLENTPPKRQRGFAKDQTETIKAVLSMYDIIAVKGLELSYLYKPKTENTYQKIDKDDLEIIVSNIYNKVVGDIDGNCIDKIMKTLDKEVRRTHQVPCIDNRFIEVCSSRFWDMEKCTLVQKLPQDSYCARRLFDTPVSGKNVVHYDTAPNPAVIEDAFERAYEDISKREGKMLPLFKFVVEWADEDMSTYRDIMLMYTSMFMGKKPFGIWVLRGQGRNGKSVAVGLLHTIFGTNNTSRIQLGKIGDWHGYLQLANTLVNASDEEDNEVLKDEALIKTIADHGEIDLSKMREQTQLRVYANFGLALCSNSDLALKGKGNEAFIRRLRIIPFNRDFSAEDSMSSMRNFAEETFTPKVIAEFVGTCMGYAAYYADHPFPLSDGMKEQQRWLEESLVSYKVYFVQFKKYFHSFHRLKQDVYTDYLNWCTDHGFEACDYTDFIIPFKPAMAKKNASNNSSCGSKPVRVHNIPGTAKGPQCFREEYLVPEFKQTIEELHKSNKSVIFELENYYAVNNKEEGTDE